MPATPGLRSALAVLAAAGALMAFLAWQDRAALHAANAAPPTPPLPPWTGPGADRSAAIATELRQLKLITSEVRTSVTSESTDVSLMGDVKATVTAPVRLLYAVDLAHLESSAITFSPIHSAYLITIPPPRRAAAEVLSQFEDAQVVTGWMRSRAKDGEYHLGLARRDLALRAQQLTPDREQMASIRKAALEQVRALILKIVGDHTTVSVRFTDDPDGSGGAGSGGGVDP